MLLYGVQTKKSTPFFKKILVKFKHMLSVAKMCLKAYNISDGWQAKKLKRER